MFQHKKSAQIIKMFRRSVQVYGVCPSTSLLSAQYRSICRNTATSPILILTGSRDLFRHTIICYYSATQRQYTSCGVQKRYFSFRGKEEPNAKTGQEETKAKEEPGAKLGGEVVKRGPIVQLLRNGSLAVAFAVMGLLSLAGRSSTQIVQFSRGAALASPEFAIFQLFGFAIFGLIFFVGSVAWVALNERRHDQQAKLRRTAQRRCVDVHNSDEFKERIIGSGGIVSRALGRGQEDTPLLSATHALDQICRISGVLALDVGQFDKNGEVRVDKASGVVADSSIGAPFTLKHTSIDKPVVVDKSLPLSQQIASLESNDFLKLVASGGMDSEHLAEGSTVLALKRRVEMFQTSESCVRNRTSDPTSSATYAYSQGWYASQQRIKNAAAHGLVLSETVSGKSEDGNPIDMIAYLPLVQRSLDDSTPVVFPFRQVKLTSQSIDLGESEILPPLGHLKLFLRPKKKGPKLGPDQAGELSTLQSVDVDPTLLSHGFTWRPLSFRDLQTPSALSDHLKTKTDRLQREYVRPAPDNFFQMMMSMVGIRNVPTKGIDALESAFAHDPNIIHSLAKLQQAAEEKREQPFIVNWSSAPPTEAQLRVPSSTLRISSCGQYLTTVQIDPMTGAEFEPRIGDVRIKYDYIRATPATIIGVVKDTQRGHGFVRRLVAWGANKSKERNAKPSLRDPNIVAANRIVAQHMPYTVTKWTYEDYLDELERTNQLIKARDEYRLSAEPVAVPTSAMRLQGTVVEMTKRQVSAAITASALGAKLSGEESFVSAEDREELEKNRGEIENFIGSAAEKLAVFNKPFIPQWALRGAEEWLHATVPLEVISVSESEDATSRSMFRAHWLADTGNTWTQRYLSFALMQGSLAAAFSLTVPLPGGIVGIGCTICACGVWLQTFGNAKLDIYRRRKRDKELHATNTGKKASV